MDKSEQDLKDTLTVADIVLKKFHEDCPQIKKVFMKSDNAGCYHANSSVELMQFILKRNELELIRYDYSEPQKGKDVCDREAAYVKQKYRNYLDRNKNNKISNAKELVNAVMSDGGPKQTKAIVISIDKSKTLIKNNQKVPNIKNYHSYVTMENNSIKYFEYFEIGTGKIISCSNVEIDFSVTRETDWILSHRQNVQICFTPKTELFYCKHPKCSAMFFSENDLWYHESLNKHQFIIVDSPMDKVRNLFLEKKMTNYIQRLPSSSNTIKDIDRDDTNAIQYIHQYEFGWARPIRNISRFSDKQKIFIHKLFSIGETTRKKLNADQMAEKMKSEKLSNGNNNNNFPCISHSF